MQPKNLDVVSSSLSVERNVVEFVLKASQSVQTQFDKIDNILLTNQAKVLGAFKQMKISSTHFAPTTGYGYDDLGRETLSALFACIFKGEAAIVSPHLLSGTHAIYLALSALLNAHDTMLSVYGKPYDTLATAIGINEDKDYPHTLIKQGVVFEAVEPKDDNYIDYEALEMRLKALKPTMVYIQRSRGYAFRPSLSIENIKNIILLAKKISPNSMIVCDNCYGEFCETSEPLEVGADLIIGSLIKNPGGGIAPNGGYIIGKKEMIEHISHRFTAPGVGAEIGSYAGSYLPFFQGIYMAPKIVSESLKGAILTAKVMASLGCSVLPQWNDERADITQSVAFDDQDTMIRFIQGIQAGSPIDSHVKPIPWDMPGYDAPVIMAAGTFIQGASIELSADAPIKKPYIAYMQGGLTYESVMYGLMTALNQMNIL